MEQGNGKLASFACYCFQSEQLSQAKGNSSLLGTIQASKNIFPALVYPKTNTESLLRVSLTLEASLLVVCQAEAREKALLNLV